MTTELAIGLLGLVVLGANMLLDHEFEVGAGWLSGAVLGAFLAVGGFTAMLVPDTVDAPVAVAIAVAAGLGGATGARALARALHRHDGQGAPQTSDLRGAVGTVVSPIPEGGAGQIATTLRGEPVRISAVAEHPVPLGAAVIVLDVVSSTQVVVSTDPRLV